MPAGIVLTGGGSLLNGMKEMAQIALRIPASIGTPGVPPMFKESLGNPMYATGYGLLMYALKKSKGVTLGELSGPLVQRIAYKMKSWAADFFRKGRTMIDFERQSDNRIALARIKVLGVGGGGSNMVNKMIILAMIRSILSLLILMLRL